MSARRALVLGGTGHLGSALARRLAREGFTTLASGRSDRARPNLEGSSVQIVIGDDSEPGVAEQWMAGADLVVDAATPYPIWLHHEKRAKTLSQAINRSKRLLDAASKAGAAFVHISSFTTLPHPPGAFSALRKGVIQGLHGYFDLKLQVEKEVLTALQSGLRGCVLSPSTCLGPFDLKPREQAFIPMLLTGRVNGLVRHDLNILDVRDLADLVTAAVLLDFPNRKIPAFGHNLCVSELAGQICRFENVPSPRIKVPSLVGLAGLYWIETACAMAGRQTPWPSLPMLLVEASYAADPSPQQKALLPRLRPLETTLRDAIAWYRRIGHV